MTIQLDRFIPGVLPSVDDCPRKLVEDEILHAVQTLCHRSRPWRETLAATDVLASDAGVVTPTTPAGTRMVRAEWATFNDELLREATHPELDRLVPDWRTATAPVPDYWTTDAPGTLRLVRAPSVDATGALVVHASLEPTALDTDLPDYFDREAWRAAIEHHALWKLLIVPRKPWSDAQLAEYHRQRFGLEAGKVAVEVATDFGTTALRTTAYAQ